MAEFGPLALVVSLPHGRSTPCFERDFGTETNFRDSMTNAELQKLIDEAWERRERLTPASHGPERDAVEEALNGLDSGRLRVAEKEGEEWRVNQWLKKAVLLSFRFNDNQLIEGAPGGGRWWD